MASVAEIDIMEAHRWQESNEANIRGRGRSGSADLSRANAADCLFVVQDKGLEEMPAGERTRAGRPSRCRRDIIRGYVQIWACGAADGTRRDRLHFALYRHHARDPLVTTLLALLRSASHNPSALSSCPPLTARGDGP